MQFRERQNETPAGNTGPGTPGEGGDGLDALRAQGSAFLEAGNSIIDASLSGDSQAFLAANRQAGGQ